MSQPTGTGHGQTRTATLVITALGVVYGDIGTSPLYAVKECFGNHAGHGRIEVTPANVCGVLSLIFWALLLVISVKYINFVTRADNEGAGGMMSLLALVPTREGTKTRSGAVVLLVLFGAALLYGDGMITPAISVLSAMEGLEVAYAPAKRVVVPLTVITLLGLFVMQKRGTAKVGLLFGPAMLVWFTMLGGLGLWQVIKNPAVLRAVSPHYAVEFFVANKFMGFIILGAVVLCITGGEALYADMGHFGRKPIVYGWYFVWPCLLLNYFGQGAMLLQNPSAEVIGNPFYALVPRIGPQVGGVHLTLLVSVLIAAFATVIASQAMISGAFSLTQQAVQMGYFPRVTIKHTSAGEAGQIYIPEINTALLIACLALVFAKPSSTELAAAYGIAVTGSMTITSTVYFVVARKAWRWPLWKAVPLVALFLTVDLSFLSANALKFFAGGWIPFAIGVVIFTVMTTWKRGRDDLYAAIREKITQLKDFLTEIEATKPHRVEGTAVFMASNPNGTPPILRHHFHHNKVLHEQVVLLSVIAEKVPDVPAQKRVHVRDLGQGFFHVTASYGFMQQPNVPEALRRCEEHGLAVDPASTSYYLGRETLLPTGRSKMLKWRKSLFAFTSRNALPATAYFRLPADRVVELGMQIDF